MQLRVAQSGDLDPCLTQSFLLSHEGILDATVWMAKGTLLSRIVVCEHFTASEFDLQKACQKKLGLEQTPRMILMERSIRRAA